MGLQDDWAVIYMGLDVMVTTLNSKLLGCFKAVSVSTSSMYGRSGVFDRSDDRSRVGRSGGRSSASVSESNISDI